MAQGISRVVSITSDTEPVTLAEAKNYLRVTVDTTDDNLITSQISAARQIAEGYLSRDILPRTREQFIIELDGLYLDLYYGPINEVTSIEAGTTELTEDDDYEIVGVSNDPYVKFNDSTHTDVKVTYTTSGLQTDNTVKQGVLAILADLYNGVDIKKSCFAILAPLKRNYF